MPACLAAAVLGALLAVTGLVVLVPVPAAAHTNLVRAVPGDGSTVTSAPDRVRLVFDENVRAPADIVVTAPSGERVQHGAVQVLDNTISVGVDVAAAGRYTIAFRVVSADGHPLAAETGFRFAPGAAQASADSHGDHPGHIGHPGQAADDPTDGGGLGRGGMIGILAGAGFLAGLALLTMRRRPGSSGRRGGDAAGSDRP